MGRLSSSFADLCLRQIPKPFQTSRTQRRNLNLCVDQINGKSEESTQNPQTQPQVVGENQIFSIGEVAKKVSDIIRNRPRWEETLLTDFPAVNFLEPSVYNEFLEQQNNVVVLLRFYVWLKGREGYLFDPVLCSVILRKIVEAGPAKIAMSVLDDTMSGPEPWELELYIYCLCENGLIDESLHVFERLKGASYVPSLETWHHAMFHSVRTNRGDVVWTLYRNMTEYGILLDVSTFGYLIKAYCLEEQSVKGYDLLRDVMQDGGVPDKTVFDMLITSLWKSSEYEKMSCVVHIMIAKGLRPDIDTYTYGYLIKAHCLEGNPVKGYELLRYVLQAVGVPDKTIFDMVIASLCKSNEYIKMSAVLHNMIAKDCSPDIDTYTGIIKGLTGRRMRPERLRIFNELKERGYCPGTSMYTTMIRSLCRDGDVAGAQKLWSEMFERGIVPDKYTYSDFIDGLCKNGCIDEAKKLYKEMIEKRHWTGKIQKLANNYHLGEVK